MIRRDHILGFVVGTLAVICLCTVGLAFFLVFASFSNVGDLIVGASTLTRTPFPANTSSAVSEPQLGKLGDVVEGGGYSLSVVAVEDPARPYVDLWYEPQPGNKLVAVEIVVGCVSCKQARVNPVFVILVDSDNAPYMVELGALVDREQIAPIDIGPGERVRGWVAFEVPKPAVPMYVRYFFDHRVILQAALNG